VSVDGLGRCVMVVPTYNESENLEWIVGRLRAAQPGVDVLVVDDNSPTAPVTSPTAGRRRPRRRSRAPHREGRTGRGLPPRLRRRARAGYDVIGEMDADGSHQPEQLQRLLDALHTADLVIGSRYVPAGRWSTGPSSAAAVARRQPLRQAAARDPRQGRDAPATACSVVRRSRRSTWLGESTGYVFQTDLAYRTVSRGLRVTEVPIEFIERERGDSKMSGQVASESLR
jgi:dolichol-phosphate mannosyltransferase